MADMRENSTASQSDPASSWRRLSVSRWEDIQGQLCWQLLAGEHPRHSWHYLQRNQLGLEEVWEHSSPKDFPMGPMLEKGTERTATCSSKTGCERRSRAGTAHPFCIMISFLPIFFTHFFPPALCRYTTLLGHAPLLVQKSWRLVRLRGRPAPPCPQASPARDWATALLCKAWFSCYHMLNRQTGLYLLR